MNYGSSAKAGPCLIMQILSFSVKFSSQQNFIFWNILLKNRIWVYLQKREQFSRKKGEGVVIPKYVCFTTFLISCRNNSRITNSKICLFHNFFISCRSNSRIANVHLTVCLSEKPIWPQIYGLSDIWGISLSESTAKLWYK